MTNLLGNNFPEPAPGAVATYNYNDIAEGTGVAIFYGLTAKTKTATSNILSTQAIHSAAGNITSDTTAESKSAGDDGTGTYTLYSTFNFDLNPFNIAKTVRGTAYVQLSQDIGDSAGAASAYFNISLVKVDGTDSTETELGNADGEVIATADGPLTINVPISLTETTFPDGDFLRLKLKAYLKHDSGDNGSTLHFAHSPDNVDTTSFTAATNPTKLTAYVPFKIEV